MTDAAQGVPSKKSIRAEFSASGPGRGDMWDFKMG